jgi:hypothetical protein
LPPAWRVCRAIDNQTAEECGTKSILLVDDNRDLADGLAELPRLNGVLVHVAYDGASGIRLQFRGGHRVVGSITGATGARPAEIVSASANWTRVENRVASASWMLIYRGWYRLKATPEALVSEP